MVQQLTYWLVADTFCDGEKMIWPQANPIKACEAFAQRGRGLMNKLIFAAALAATVLTAGSLGAKDAPSAAPRDMDMWRLECGDIHLADGAIFSDAHLFDGQPRGLAGSCYLIRHGKDYLLWDAGLPKSLIGAPTSDHGVSLSLKRSIVDQLAEIGVDPKAVSKVAVSHYHFDHTSQLPDFPGATLLISEGDWAVVSSKEEGIPYLERSVFASWLGRAGGKVLTIAKDHDVFGDGSVLIKATPGHTPGHTSLLVRLPQTGDVLLTGDLYHFQEQAFAHSVPDYNFSRVQTLASMTRFDETAKNLNAKVIIQHDPRHVGRLPAFPASAK
jgi:N-acyl homoserine lactone hydrolase